MHNYMCMNHMSVVDMIKFTSLVAGKLCHVTKHEDGSRWVARPILGTNSEPKLQESLASALRGTSDFC